CVRHWCLYTIHLQASNPADADSYTIHVNAVHQRHAYSYQDDQMHNSIVDRIGIPKYCKENIGVHMKIRLSTSITKKNSLGGRGSPCLRSTELTILLPMQVGLVTLLESTITPSVRHRKRREDAVIIAHYMLERLIIQSTHPFHLLILVENLGLMSFHHNSTI
ncbi:hypothetical protein ACJX0J_014888, partial [Zea mays]